MQGVMRVVRSSLSIGSRLKNTISGSTGIGGFDSVALEKTQPVQEQSSNPGNSGADLGTEETNRE